MTTTRTIAIALLLRFGALASAQPRRPQAQPTARSCIAGTKTATRSAAMRCRPKPPNARAPRSARRAACRPAQVARALTAEERAAAAAAAEQAQVAADAEAARQRRDLAMVESYATEADLRRAYGERISLLESTLKASQLGEANLRLSLASLLNQASDLELSGKPVPAALLANVRGQHAELQKQQRILAQQQRDRGALDGELATAVARYRALKQAQSADATGAAPAATPPPRLSGPRHSPAGTTSSSTPRPARCGRSRTP